MCREAHHRLGGAPALASLARGPRRIARAVARASGTRLRRRPRPREWSVVEVLGHLLDAEVALGFRIRKLAAEPGAAIVPWDQELLHHWAEHDLIHLEQIQSTLGALARR